MKCIKPLTLGLLHRPYRTGDEHRFVISALGFFKLGADNPRFLVDNLAWPQVATALPPQQMLDEVMPKAQADVLLAGHAYAPEGKPVAQMAVALRVGPLHKQLRIVGNRSWSFALLPWYRISPPRTFTQMPLDASHAFGGPLLATNPVGKGYNGNRFAAFRGKNLGVLPNIEAPQQPVTRPWRRYAPAGFGALAIHQPPRVSMLGKLHIPPHALATAGLPGLPAPVNPGLLQMARPDQQLSGFLAGGEAYCLSGMHPSEAQIEGHLPALAARGFIQRSGQALAEEVPLHCDTVWFFPDLMLGVMIWHGETRISNSLALDVQSVMVGYEQTGQARPLAHYQQVMQRRTDPAGHDVFNESQLAASYSPAEQARRAASHAAEIAADTAQQQAILDEHTADFWAASGMQAPPDYVPPKVAAPALPQPSRQQLRELDFDVGASVLAARALGQQRQQEGEAQLAAAQAQLASMPPAPQPGLRQQQQSVLERAVVSASDLHTPPTALPAALQSLLDLANATATPALNAEQQALVAQLPQLQRQARQAAPAGDLSASKLDPVVAAWLGQQVALWYAGGALLAGRDLAGARLAGMDFSGADLREVMLDYADLSHARFVGANLSKAVLAGATLDGADFSGADLGGANLNLSHGLSINFTGANLNGAQADQACWPAADLSDCKLAAWRANQINLSQATLERADLTGALLLKAIAPDSCWRAAILNKTMLLRADLSRADASAAVLTQTTLVEAHLAGSNWSGACFNNVVAGSADWRGAVLCHARGTGSNWGRALLAGADLSAANLQRCDFSFCDLSHARLTDACLAGSLFMGADLSHAEAANTDFYQALLRQTRFNQADLRRASLVQADLAEADLAHAQLDNLVLEAHRRLT